MTVLRKSFYIHWSAGRSPRVHEVNPGRDPSKEVEEAVSKSGESVPPHDPPVEDLERALRDYALPLIGIPPMIMPLAIPANNFEIKPITLGFYY